MRNRLRVPSNLRDYWDKVEMSSHILHSYLTAHVCTTDEVTQIVRQVLPEGAEEPMGIKPDAGPIPDRHDWVEPIEAFLGDGIDE